MKIIFAIFSLLFSYSIYAQSSIIKGKIYDRKTGASLAYANIGLLGTTQGTVSAPDGKFVLYLDENIDKNAMIRVSYLGYGVRDFMVADFLQRERHDIYLEQNTYELAAVEVRPGKPNLRTAGHRKISTDRLTNFAISNKKNQNLGAAIGRKFKLEKGTKYLERFSFYVAENNFEEVRFRVSIHDLASEKPNKNLNRKDIIISLSAQQTGWVEVPLSSCPSIEDTEIAVVIEWVYHSENGTRLSLPLSMPAWGTHFYKYGSQDNWKRFRGMSTAMYLEY